jgi:hypothetical protein
MRMPVAVCRASYGSGGRNDVAGSGRNGFRIRISAIAGFHSASPPHGQCTCECTTVRPLVRALALRGLCPAETPHLRGARESMLAPRATARQTSGAPGHAQMGLQPRSFSVDHTECLKAPECGLIWFFADPISRNARIVGLTSAILGATIAVASTSLGEASAWI